MGDSAVIVGAGIGGLTAAAYPARAGLDVAVYEQHALPGGYVSLGQTNRTVHERYFRKSLVGRILDLLGYPVMPGRNTLGMWMTYHNDTWVPSGGMQAFVVYLGLRGGSELDRALERFQTSHVCFSCADGECVQLALLSKDDPTAAPPGKHALFVGRLVAYSEWEPFKNDRSGYRAEKTAVSGSRAICRLSASTPPVTMSSTPAASQRQ